MPFNRVSMWWAGLGLLIVALAVTAGTGRNRVAAILAVLLVVYLGAQKLGAHFMRTSTPIRILWSIAGLVVLWLLLFVGLLPELSHLGLVPSRPVVVLSAPQKLYLALAVSVPLLSFLFGSGPLCQYGSMRSVPDFDPIEEPAATGADDAVVVED